MEFETTTTDEDGNTVKDPHLGRGVRHPYQNGGLHEISREGSGSRQLSITSETAEGYNTAADFPRAGTKLAELQLPDGVTAELAELRQASHRMLGQMARCLHWHWLFV